MQWLYIVDPDDNHKHHTAWSQHYILDNTPDAKIHISTQPHLWPLSIPTRAYNWEHRIDTLVNENSILHPVPEYGWIKILDPHTCALKRASPALVHYIVCEESMYWTPLCRVQCPISMKVPIIRCVLYMIVYSDAMNTLPCTQKFHLSSHLVIRFSHYTFQHCACCWTGKSTSMTLHGTKSSPK